MNKTLLLLFAALCTTQTALAATCVEIKNNDGSKTASLCAATGDRICYCIKNTQTASIKGVNGGTIRLFSTNDCKGNYQTLGSNSKINNAQWVNSFSLGPSGIASEGPSGCPDWY